MDCRAMQLAKRKNYGNFKQVTVNLDICNADTIHLEFYSNAGRQLGANKQTYEESVFAAKEQFMKMLATMLEDFRGVGWQSRVSFEFGGKQSDE